MGMFNYNYDAIVYKCFEKIVRKIIKMKKVLKIKNKK